MKRVKIFNTEAAEVHGVNLSLTDFYYAFIFLQEAGAGSVCDLR